MSNGLHVRRAAELDVFDAFRPSAGDEASPLELVEDASCVDGGGVSVVSTWMTSSAGG